MNQNNNRKNEKKGFLNGLIYGLVPHVGCIAVVLSSVLGTTVATSFLKPFLLNSYFFYILIGLSFLLATVSALFYLKRNRIFSLNGVKRSWRYLLILYGTTITVNLILFLVIFPLMTNIKASSDAADLLNNPSNKFLTLEVAIPCSGHAPLITDELYKIGGVKNIKFRLPNLFDIIYDSNKVSEEKIVSLDVFKTYKATIIQ